MRAHPAIAVAAAILLGFGVKLFFSVPSAEADASSMRSVSKPPPKSPAWNDGLVRDSAAAAGVPSRNNVYEFGFPDPGQAELSKREPSAPRGVFDTDAFPTSSFPPFQGDAPGGVPGMMARAGVIDPSNPNPPPPGGLAALVQDYLRNNPQ